jgi:hypothetical protein
MIARDLSAVRMHACAPAPAIRSSVELGVGETIDGMVVGAGERPAGRGGADQKV